MTTLSELQGSAEFQSLPAGDQQRVLDSVTPAPQQGTSWGAVESSPEFTGLSFDDQNRVRSHYGVAEAEKPSRSWGESVKDTALKVMGGFGSAVDSIVSLSDMILPGDQRDWLKEKGLYDKANVSGFWEQGLSEAQKYSDAEVQAAEGFVDTLGAYYDNPKAMFGDIVKTAPEMLVMLAGTGALKAGLKIPSLFGAAASEGALATGHAESGFREALGRETTIKERGAALATGMATAGITAISGKIGAEIGARDLDTLFISKGMSKEAAAKMTQSVVPRMIKSGVTEGILEEALQGAVEQMIENAVLDKGIFEGVPKAMAQGIAVGTPMGMGAGIASPVDTLEQTEIAATKLENTRDENGFLSTENVVKASEIREAGKPVVAEKTIEERAVEVGKRYDAMRTTVREGLEKPLPAEQAILDEVDAINNELVEQDIQKRVVEAEVTPPVQTPPVAQIVEPAPAENLQDVQRIAQIKQAGRAATAAAGMKPVAAPEPVTPTVPKAEPVTTPHVDAMTTAVSQGGIDIASAKQMFSHETIAALNKKRPGLFRVNGGQQIDEMAGELGYDSANTMVESWSSTGMKQVAQVDAQIEEQKQFDIAEDAAQKEQIATTKLYGEFRSEILKEPAAVSVEEINDAPFTDSQKADLIKLRGVPRVKRISDKPVDTDVPFDSPRDTAVEPLTEKRAGIRERSFERKLNQTLKGNTAQTDAIMSVLNARAGATGVSTGEYLNQRGMDIVPDSQAFNEGQRQANKGAVVINEHEAVIHAFSQADGTTALHEMGHIFRRDLVGKDAGVIEKWVGVKDGKWDTPAEEKFARGFENYIATGKAPTQALQNAFKKLKEIMMSVYGSLSHPDIDIDISPEVRAVFDRMLSGETVGTIQKGGGVDTLFQQAGIESRTADTSSLFDATQRLKAGNSPEQIRQDTGWHLGKDKKWRYEIDDSDAKFLAPFYNEGDYGDLEKYLDHPKLYEAYPDLRQLDVDVISMRRGNHGRYVPNNWNGGYINLNSNSKTGDLEETLLHEIQHAIQYIEGFEGGGSVANIRMDDRPINPMWTKWNNDPIVKEFQKYRDSADYREQLRDSEKLYRDKYAKDFRDITQKEDDGLISAPEAMTEFDVLDASMREEQKEKFPLIGKIQELADSIEGGFRQPEYYLSPFETYQRLHGEIEARDTAARVSMTVEERKQEKPYVGQGIPMDQAIVRYTEQRGESTVDTLMQATTKKLDTTTETDIESKYDTIQPTKKEPTVDTVVPERELTGKTLSPEAKYEKETELKSADFYSRYSENVKDAERGQRSLPPLAVPDRGVAVPEGVARENFKDWFGESLAVGGDGNPMVWFHGSPTFGKVGDPESWSFDPARRGELVKHTFTGFGTTFTSNFSEADISTRGKADPLAFHIRIENPYILTDADVAKLSRYSKDDKHTAKAEAFMKRKMDLGDYDSIYNPTTGFVYLAESNQSKSLANTGLYGETGDVLMQSVGKPVDTDSPEFKRWFGDSKVVDEDGEPLVVYHGTDKEFTEFERASNTFDYLGEGIYFSNVKKVAAKYGGKIEDVYLSINNPETYDAKGKSFNEIVDDIRPLLKHLGSFGNDGLIIDNVFDSPSGKRKGKKSTIYIADEPTQIKSAVSNVGTFDPTDPNILYQSTPVTAEDYDTMVATSSSVKNRVKRNISSSLKEISKGFDKYMGSISTRLGDIDKRLKSDIRKLDYNIGTKQAEDVNSVLDMLEATKRMSRVDHKHWDYARKNSDTQRMNELIDKYDFRSEYDAYREVMTSIHGEAEGVGLDIGFVKDYSPRILRDKTGFLNHIGKGDDWGRISEAINKRATEMDVPIRGMTKEMKADIASNIMFGGMTGMGGPGHTKARKMQQIPADLDQYYMDSDSALVAYLHSMRKTIEQRKFFGKVPDKISLAKANMHRQMTALRKEGITDERKQVLQDNIKMYRDIIDRFKYNRDDYNESISQYVMEQVLKGNIDADQENTLTDIMQARFHEHGTSGMIQAYKNFSYIDTMGSPISALTQIGDQAFAAYEGGWINALKNSAKAFRGKSRITKEDVGIDRMAQEFADESTLARAVNKVFKMVGLEKMDSIGKESLLNTSLEKFEKRANKEPGKLADDIRHIFEGETDDVIADLQNKDITDNVKLLVYDRLLDFQPVALSEMPEQYLKAGNGRIFYMLKTYTLKQFDIFRRESYKKIRHGNRAEKIQGFKNMARLSLFLVLANATADELKDLALGRETDMSDRLVDNLLRLLGVSKFVTWQARQEGLPTALAKQVLPPFKFFNNLTKDIITAGDEKGLLTASSVPVVGKLADWHMGRSSHKRSDLWQRRLSKKKASLKKIKDRVERNPDEKEKYRKELRTLGRVNKFQGKVNRLKRDMNDAMAAGLDSKADRIEKRRNVLIKEFLQTL